MSLRFFCIFGLVAHSSSSSLEIILSGPFLSRSLNYVGCTFRVVEEAVGVDSEQVANKGRDLVENKAGLVLCA